MKSVRITPEVVADGVRWAVDDALADTLPRGTVLVAARVDDDGALVLDLAKDAVIVCECGGVVGVRAIGEHYCDQCGQIWVYQWDRLLQLGHPDAAEPRGVIRAEPPPPDPKPRKGI